MPRSTVLPLKRPRPCRYKVERRLDLWVTAWVFCTAGLIGFAGEAAARMVSDTPGFTVMDRVRHLGAYANCTNAWAMGLGPAERGQPGYWPKHDADGDGVACEIKPIPPIVLILPFRLRL